MDEYVAPDFVNGTRVNVVGMDMPRETTRQRLERMKKNLEEQLNTLNRSLELLDKNPGLEELHEVLRRV